MEKDYWSIEYDISSVLVQVLQIGVSNTNSGKVSSGQEVRSSAGRYHGTVVWVVLASRRTQMNNRVQINREGYPRRDRYLSVSEVNLYEIISNFVFRHKNLQNSGRTCSWT